MGNKAKRWVMESRRKTDGIQMERSEITRDMVSETRDQSEHEVQRDAKRDLKRGGGVSEANC